MATFTIGEDAKPKRTQVIVGFDSSNGQLTAWPSTEGMTFTADQVVFSKQRTKQFYLEMKKYFEK